MSDVVVSEGYFVGDIFYERQHIQARHHRHKKIGALWWGGSKHYARVALDFWAVGVHICWPAKGVEAPCLDGDIVWNIKRHNGGNAYSKQEWCGLILSHSGASGNVYYTVELGPMPVHIEYGNSPVWLGVKLTSDAKKASE